MTDEPTIPIEPIPGPEVDPLAELPEVTPYGRNWDQKLEAHPAPEVSNTDPWPEDVDVPSSVAAFKKWAEKRGYTVRLAYSRGFKTGHTKADPWPRLEIIGAWCTKPGRTNVVITWERLPDGKTPAWKAHRASFRHGVLVIGMGHTPAKQLMAVVHAD